MAHDLWRAQSKVKGALPFTVGKTRLETNSSRAVGVGIPWCCIRNSCSHGVRVPLLNDLGSFVPERRIQIVLVFLSGCLPCGMPQQRWPQFIGGSRAASVPSRVVGNTQCSADLGYACQQILYGLDWAGTGRGESSRHIIRGRGAEIRTLIFRAFSRMSYPLDDSPYSAQLDDTRRKVRHIKNQEVDLIRFDGQFIV